MNESTSEFKSIKIKIRDGILWLPLLLHDPIMILSALKSYVAVEHGFFYVIS